jgi:hypothetical protein
VSTRLSVLAFPAFLAAGLLTAPANATPSPKAQYAAALDRLAGVSSFRMVERLDVIAGTPRVVVSEIRYRAPNRMQMIVTTLVPGPATTFSQVTVGRRECQAPPGVCFHAHRPDLPRAVHRLLGPAVPVTYRVRRDHSGHRVISMTKRINKHSTYAAHLTLAANGRPLSFAGYVWRDKREVVRQTATFAYVPVSIRLPR